MCFRASAKARQAQLEHHRPFFVKTCSSIGNTGASFMTDMLLTAFFVQTVGDRFARWFFWLNQGCSIPVCWGLSLAKQNHFLPSFFSICISIFAECSRSAEINFCNCPGWFWSKLWIVKRAYNFQQTLLRKQKSTQIFQLTIKKWFGIILRQIPLHQT